MDAIVEVKMTFQDYFTLVMAISTVIYTIGTFLLWWVNKRNVNALEQQLLVLKEQLERQGVFNKVLASNSALDSHREIWLPIISNPILLGSLQNHNPKEEERVGAEFLGSVLINHCARIHLNFQHELFDASEFSSFSRDARYLFSLPLVRWRWNGVAKYHSSEFVKFVQDQIIS